MIALDRTRLTGRLPSFRLFAELCHSLTTAGSHAGRKKHPNFLISFSSSSHAGVVAVTRAANSLAGQKKFREFC
jgi:hypothetical protein